MGHRHLQRGLGVAQRLSYAAPLVQAILITCATPMGHGAMRRQPFTPEESYSALRYTSSQWDASGALNAIASAPYTERTAPHLG